MAGITKKKAAGGNVWTGKKNSPTTAFDLHDKAVFICSSWLSALSGIFIIAGRAIPPRFFIPVQSGNGLWASKTTLYWVVAMGAGLTFCLSTILFVGLCRLADCRDFTPATKVVFWAVLPVAAMCCFAFMMSFSGN